MSWPGKVVTVISALAVGTSGAAATAGPATPDAEPPGCSAPARVLAGIDVSSFQGAIDWSRVKTAGVVFAFARVSDGLAVIDERFADNFAAMRRARIRRGAYQLFRAAADPEAQADLLVRTVRRHGGSDLPLVADVETDDGASAEELRERLARWLRRVERRTQRRPIIYTSPSMSELLAGRFGDYHLWVAHYEVECPRLPAGWRRWAFWQRSSTGRVTGINGNVDLDTFAGTVAELRRFGRPKAAPARPHQ